MKLLVIDDDKIIARQIVSNLSKENWTIDYASSFLSATDILSKKKYDIIICDYDLGKSSSKNGVNLIKEARMSGVTTPVILLTGKTFEEITPWDALDAGFDDFIKKPYEPKELKARISAILRRKINKGNNVSNFLTFKNIKINFVKRKVTINGKVQKVGNTLFLLLFKLIENKGKMVGYEELTEYIWGEDSLYEPQYTSTLRVHITHLKKILGDSFSENIRNVHGVGFILDDSR